MLGVFAEFERAILQERIHAGIARARRNGTKVSAPERCSESGRSTGGQVESRAARLGELLRRWLSH
jgi:DNA invertase Pin-like site-specific DNA recombinase